MPRPNPRLPPVTMTLAIATSQFAGSGDVERRYDPNRHRNLVRGQTTPAEAEYSGFERRGFFDHVSGIAFEARGYDIGNDDRPSDRIFPRFDDRHLHARMAVDYGFDLLGMDLATADIDDSAFSADEIVSIAVTLDHVAGVDEAIGIGEFAAVGAEVAQGRARRSQPERAVLDLHVDAVLA